MKTRILFVAEAVTMAHVARPLFLAAALDAAHHEVMFACDPRYHSLFVGKPWSLSPLHSITGDEFLKNLSRGLPLYDAGTLRTYVRDDLVLIDKLRPELIVGDFRLSLWVSARLAKIPYIAITNAYWSPFAREHFPLPVHPMVRVLGLPLSEGIFSRVRPLAFAYHTLALNRVRREHGLPSLGHDLRRAYTDADHVLYADIPELVRTYAAPDNHSYLGPILWSPPVPPPLCWNQLPRDRPIVYATLGSSGDPATLAVICDALGDLPITLIAATATRSKLVQAPANTYVADYLPGLEACARAAAMVCNGGSLSTHQALSAGIPVLGIASNMDQFLSMQSVTRAGAGMTLRADRVSAAAVRAGVQRVLNDSSIVAAARAMAPVLARYSAAHRFAQYVAKLVP